MVFDLQKARKLIEEANAQIYFLLESKEFLDEEIKLDDYTKNALDVAFNYQLDVLEDIEAAIETESLQSNITVSILRTDELEEKLCLKARLN